MADFSRVANGASGGLGRLAMALGGGRGGAYQNAYDNELGLQSKLAQALATIEAQGAAAQASRAKAEQDTTETRIMAGRGDVGDELLAGAAGTDIPTLKAYRDQRRTGRPAMTSATGDADTDAAIGINPQPQVSSAIAQALARLEPRYAVYRTSTKDQKADDLAKADSIYRETDLSDAIIKGQANRNTVAGAQAAAGGKDLFHADSTGSVLDKFTGALDTANPMARSTINLRDQQAGQAKAGAAENYAQADNARASASKTRKDMERDARSGDIKEVVGPDGSVYLVNKVNGLTRQVVGPDGRPLVSGKAGGSGTGAGKPMTEGQAKSNLFGGRMTESDAVLREMEQAGVYRPGNIKALTEGVAGAVPIIGDSLREGASAATNWTQSARQQQVDQARRDFINATLRRESGAVISQEEFANADKQYFPQMGDSKQVLEQKRRNRELATQLMLQEVPEHHRYKPKPKAPAKTSQAAAAPEGSWGGPTGGRNVKVDY